MKIAAIILSLTVAAAMTAPAEAAAKKRKKVVQRTHHGLVQARPSGRSYDVYVGNELVGRDPDPSIRAYMMRNPHIWDGPE